MLMNGEPLNRGYVSQLYKRASHKGETHHEIVEDGDDIEQDRGHQKAEVALHLLWRARLRDLTYDIIITCLGQSAWENDNIILLFIY